MKQYRFRNEKRYRRRRSTLLLILITVILAASAYALLAKDSPLAGIIPTASPTETASVPGTATPGAEPTETASATPTPTPTPSEVPKNGIETEDHGFLPAYESIGKSGDMEDIKAKVEDFVSKQSSKYGVHFIDLATGESFGVNDHDEYVAASTSKLPINVFLFKKIEAGEISLDDMISYQKEDVEPGTGIIQNEPFGTEYTVRETSKLSVIHSDNAGINMILRLVGKDKVSEYILGLGGEIYYAKRHRTSPHDLALVTQDLYKHYTNNPDLYGELIHNLENTDWNERINGLLPKDVKVAHKIGNQPAYRTFNDVGIVFASHPYVLAVMAEEIDYGASCKGISELSKMIYDEVEAYASK